MDTISDGILFIKLEIARENADVQNLVEIADDLLQCALFMEATVGREVVGMIQEIRDALLGMFETVVRGQVGRPKLIITSRQVAFFIQHGFTTVAIADIYCCSEKTIQRRLREAGLTKSDFYSQISDDELVQKITRWTHENPNLGEKSIDGLLRSQNIHVQRRRVREALYFADPEGTKSRSTRALHRRVYNVAGPNHLWHVDGYHKLIRWKFVIHGGIDGYSRLVVYLKVATNNKAETAFDAFLEGVENYNIPSRVRSDHGGENVLIAHFMISHRGSGRGSMITGRSVHNQRIERLWRDLFAGCVSCYYYLFYAMEEEGLLNPNSNVDLYVLHMVFLSKIQTHLDQFRHGWCNHRLRTEHNKTPLQLWISEIQPPNEEVNYDDYGNDWNELIAGDIDETVHVPELPALLDQTQLANLDSIIVQMTLGSSDLVGLQSNHHIWIQQYINVKHYVLSCLSEDHNTA